jgi:hypothetical protein
MKMTDKMELRAMDICWNVFRDCEVSLQDRIYIAMGRFINENDNITARELLEITDFIRKESEHIEEVHRKVLQHAEEKRKS